ncbi:MAG: DEAD/DEAH box helicase [Candidatus Poseidoniaceae archaeon]
MSWGLNNQPRDWQNEALNKWSTNGSRGIAKVVTGGGKTFFALMCMESLAKKHPDLRFLVIVPTVALRDQWTVDIVEDLSVGRDEVYCHGLDKSVLPPHRIFVMVINSARSLTDEITSSGEWMLIVDECHRAATEENRKGIAGTWKATLGLSATPERQYDDLFTEILVPTLGTIIADYDYKSARIDGVISDFELRNYHVPLTDSEKEDMDKINKSIAAEISKSNSPMGEPSTRLFNLLLARSRLSQSLEFRIPIAARVCQEFVGKKMIIFHEKIVSAELLNLMLDSLGFRVTIYHSKLSSQERFNNLRDFKTGMKDVLVTCRALDEGLNVKDAEIGIIVASTKSIRQRIQRLGRVLRTSDEKERSVVITIYSDAEREALINEARGFENLVETKWFGE